MLGPETETSSVSSGPQSTQAERRQGNTTARDLTHQNNTGVNSSDSPQHPRRYFRYGFPVQDEGTDRRMMSTLFTTDIFPVYGKNLEISKFPDSLHFCGVAREARRRPRQPSQTATTAGLRTAV